jgi:hypothetical protein
MVEAHNRPTEYDLEYLESGLAFYNWPELTMRQLTVGPGEESWRHFLAECSARKCRSAIWQLTAIHRRASEEITSGAIFGDGGAAMRAVKRARRRQQNRQRYDLERRA